MRSDQVNADVDVDNNDDGVGGSESRVLPGDVSERPEHLGLDRRPDDDVVESTNRHRERHGRQSAKSQQRASHRQEGLCKVVLGTTEQNDPNQSRRNLGVLILLSYFNPEEALQGLTHPGKAPTLPASMSWVIFSIVP